MDWILPLFGGLGLGSLLTNIAKHFLDRRAISEKREYEETLTAGVEYQCPECKHEGEKEVPFKRKKVEGVDTLRVECDKCKAKIDITKKMKEKKGKKGKEEEMDDDE